MTNSFIPYSTQHITEDDIAAVNKVLRSPFLTQGPMVQEFESSICKYSDARHAVAVSSATAGLHLALTAMGITTKSIVWTSPNTFVSTANVALLLGATVDFVDIEIETGNLSIAELNSKLKAAYQNDCLPSVLIVVHFGGQPCDMTAIAELCHKYGVSVIEDAAHALGAEHYSGAKVGSCAASKATVFSFHPVKSITAGEGGVVTTNDPELSETIKMLRTHGITRDSDRFKAPGDHAGWYYEQQLLGFNYRITDLQAALGANQMTRLDNYIVRRRELAQWYQERLAGSSLALPQPSSRSAWHLYPVLISEKAACRDHVYEKMRLAGIGVNVHYIPVHLQPHYQNLGFSIGDFPESEKWFSRELSLPLHPQLTTYQQEHICDVLCRSLAE